MKSDGTPYGPQVDFINVLAKKYDFKVQATAIPAELDTFLKATVSNSSFTRCLAAVGMGFLDFCIGSFTETAERLSLAEMSPNLFHSNRYIFSRLYVDTVWDIIMGPFKPFAFGTWLIVVVVILSKITMIF